MESLNSAQSFSSLGSCTASNKPSIPKDVISGMLSELSLFKEHSIEEEYIPLVYRVVRKLLGKYDCNNLFSLLDSIKESELPLFQDNNFITYKIETDVLVSILKLTVLREIKQNNSLSKNVFNSEYNKQNVFNMELTLGLKLWEQSSNLRTLLIIGNTLLRSEQFPLAKRIYEKIISFTQNEIANESDGELILGSAHYHLALCQVSLTENQKSISKEAQENYKIAREKLHYYSFIGTFGELCMDRFDKFKFIEDQNMALESFKLECSISPKNLMTHYNLGQCYRRQAIKIKLQNGDPTQELKLALKSYEIVVSKYDPNKDFHIVDVFFNIAIVLCGLNQKDQAEKMLELGRSYNRQQPKLIITKD